MKNQFSTKRMLQVVLATAMIGAATCQGWASVQSSSEVWVGSASPAQGTGGSASRMSMFSLRMIRPIETAGVVSTLLNTVLTDTNCTWTDHQFGTAGLAAYAEFDNGWMADIADCSAANHSLTLAGALANTVAEGSHYRVHKHCTIASVFGPNNEAGLKSGFNPSTADNILLEIPQTQQVITIFYYDDGTFHGWLDATFSAAGNLIIYPEQGVLIRRRVATDLNVYLAGPVKVGPTVVPVDVGNNLVGTLKSATSLTLPALNLYTGDPGTGLASGSNPSGSDNLLVVQPNGSTATYFFYSDSSYQGWLDASFNVADGVQIAPGSAFFIRRKGPNAFNWTIPAE
jgi:hypothetical protein